MAALAADIKEWFRDGGIELDARSLLKASTIFAGVFLIVAGIMGTSAIFPGVEGGFSYIIGSMYAIVFGILVQVGDGRHQS